MVVEDRSSTRSSSTTRPRMSGQNAIPYRTHRASLFRLLRSPIENLSSSSTLRWSLSQVRPRNALSRPLLIHCPQPLNGHTTTSLSPGKWGDASPRSARHRRSSRIIRFVGCTACTTKVSARSSSIAVTPSKSGVAGCPTYTTRAGPTAHRAQDRRRHHRPVPDRSYPNSPVGRSAANPGQSPREQPSPRTLERYSARWVRQDTERVIQPSRVNRIGVVPTTIGALRA